MNELPLPYYAATGETMAIGHRVQVTTLPEEFGVIAGFNVSSVAAIGVNGPRPTDLTVAVVTDPTGPGEAYGDRRLVRPHELVRVRPDVTIALPAELADRVTAGGHALSIAGQNDLMDILDEVAELVRDAQDGAGE